MLIFTCLLLCALAATAVIRWWMRRPLSKMDLTLAAVDQRIKSDLCRR